MRDESPILTCPVCGKPYRFYSMMVGDQSMCRACVRAANEAVEAPDTPEQVRRRRRAFGSDGVGPRYPRPRFDEFFFYAVPSIPLHRGMTRALAAADYG